jgi:hypothetical protein
MWCTWLLQRLSQPCICHKRSHFRIWCSHLNTDYKYSPSSPSSDCVYRWNICPACRRTYNFQGTRFSLGKDYQSESESSSHNRHTDQIRTSFLLYIYHRCFGLSTLSNPEDRVDRNFDPDQEGIIQHISSRHLQDCTHRSPLDKALSRNIRHPRYNGSPDHIWRTRSIQSRSHSNKSYMCQRYHSQDNWQGMRDIHSPLCLEWMSHHIRCKCHQDCIQGSWLDRGLSLYTDHRLSNEFPGHTQNKLPP